MTHRHRFLGGEIVGSTRMSRACACGVYEDTGPTGWKMTGSCPGCGHVIFWESRGREWRDAVTGELHRCPVKGAA